MDEVPDIRYLKHKSYPASNCMQPENIRVIVIGAGLSGLTAAEQLLESGRGRIDVNVIEAMDRVGGRTQTIEI